ncbi:MAG: hypothetical protein EA381_14250 [Planctomycetaceae bacterium]|nr:MAG: hypothetical protein EA381_14250 [Planctomycetaceae bacterium]
MPEDEHAKSQIDSLIRAMGREVRLEGASESGEHDPVGPRASGEHAAGPASNLSRAKPVNAGAAASGSVSNDGDTARDSAERFDARVWEVEPGWAEGLGAWCEAIATEWAAAASPRLRMPIEITVRPAQAMACRDLVATLESPGCFHLLRLDPPAGPWLIEIQRSLAEGMIDRMLGGDAEPGPADGRPLTDIEVRLVARLVGDWLPGLARGWRRVGETEVHIRRFERDPRRLSLGDWDAAVTVLSMDCSLANLSGRVRLVLPIAPDDPRLAKLIETPGGERSNSAPDSSGALAEMEAGRELEGERARAEVELVVTLATSRIHTRDLLDLEVGDLITTEQDESAALELALQGVPKFRVRPGALREMKAIRIEGPISE